MTDGDWNGSPNNYFTNPVTPEIENDTIDVLDSIELDIDLSAYDLSASASSQIQLDLEVIGDHNDPDGETLTIETVINEGELDEATLDTSVLFNTSATESFWSGEVGPTTTGAQPAQGNLYIIDSDGVEIRSTLPPGQSGGLDSFSDDTVNDIIDETAELFSEDGESASLSTTISAAGVDTITLNLQIPTENSPDDGVDISQTSATASLVVDFDSTKDISNMVFYFSDGDGGCLKLKIDDFDEFWENLNPGYDSTSTFDMMIDDATLKALFNEFFGDALDAKYDLGGDAGWEDDWEFAGFSTKAGANFDLEYTNDQLKK
ncbi:hypothetical protein M1105_11210 [Limibaculum sp. FT325]|uniref:hypothetical protein n=1 Tax=Thermohalobaculum sediminis TaxID=2939436 RepID=UPI0020BE24C1|nr:hypothetical protein [Limibaculum sediminis]MCL5777553.1 hypothetical protein [Limibaculum sediminis]